LSDGLAISDLQALARYAAPAFVSPAAWDALARIPDVFGPVFGWCGLECRLDTDEQVDLMVCIERRNAAAAHEALGRSAWADRWRREEEWLGGWAASRGEAAPYVWLEFDAPLRPEDQRLLFFVPFEVVRGSPPPGDQLEKVVVEASLLEGGALSERREQTLRRAVVAIPPGGWPLHIASLRNRNIDAFRIVVSVPAAAAPSYLRTIGWS